MQAWMHHDTFNLQPSFEKKPPILLRPPLPRSVLSSHPPPFFMQCRNNETYPSLSSISAVHNLPSIFHACIMSVMFKGHLILRSDSR